MVKPKVTDKTAFVDLFLRHYLEDGLGVMSKREIDILVMHLLMTHSDLAGRSNHDLSLLLRATESRIKGLRYEANLKYPPDDDYVRREFLVVLGKAQFEVDRKEGSDLDRLKVAFVLEDVFLRQQLQGRLKAKGMFADTSFNSEIVRIECGSLITIIAELYGQETAGQFREGFQALLDPEKKSGPREFREAAVKFILDTAKSIFTTVVVAEIKARLGL